jgi:uncharacterized protein YecE (DUF72 family)
MNSKNQAAANAHADLRPVNLIGTAGWSVPRACARRFPADASHLQRYAQRLHCAEINSSFYRSHARATYQRWASAVPPTFKFSVKIPKQITHDARLVRVRVPLRGFLDEIAGLGKHLGPLLMQLPPSFSYDGAVAQRFFSLLRKLYAGSVVIEPRHISWFSGNAGDLLAKHRIAYVVADPALDVGIAQPRIGRETLHYYRLHGSPRMYWSSYSRSCLRELAKEVKATKSTVWIIFDNTAGGCGTANALELQAMLKAQVSNKVSARALQSNSRVSF